ncbi:MAG: helix-turn-helix domain-containing protein, partial [Phycisphaerales bacterium JB058]
MFENHHDPLDPRPPRGIDDIADRPELLTADEAASTLRISKSTLYKLVSRRQISRCVARGRPLLFRREGLIDEYWRVRRRGRPPPRPPGRGAPGAAEDLTNHNNQT